ncbi:hypothetical protein H920_01874 [Fukomys damarensis]|uniref:Uncharacterized protein n=1 Tax=Fukomys damarensis TaxID=885580 RepID=A0A091E1T5_FUKDA|nr:hypothetical protein H920_01874 [Fukomys damarensis]
MREVWTAAQLPVTDSKAQPMGSEKMTSSPREVWNWTSRGVPKGDNKFRSGMEPQIPVTPQPPEVRRLVSSNPFPTVTEGADIDCLSAGLEC